MNAPHTEPDYRIWPLVILDSLAFINFAFSFAKSQTSSDWRSFGAFSAYFAALFAEMYGFPLAGWRMSLLIAALAMSLSSASVIFSALRLR